ncbi:hypothetical protein MASR2M74_31720 [Paracoccaceae bacterium]
MDLNRLINMIINKLMGRVVNGAINKGADMLSKRGRPSPEATPVEMTPEERKQAQEAKKLAQRARQMQKASRKLF